MEPADTLQHLPEYLPGHSHLSKLEHQPPRVTNWPPPILMSLIWTLRNDQCLTTLGRYSLRRKLPSS